MGAPQPTKEPFPMLHDFSLSLPAYGLNDLEGRCEIIVSSHGAPATWSNPSEPAEFELGSVELWESSAWASVRRADGGVSNVRADVYASLPDDALGNALSAAIRAAMESQELVDGDIQTAIIEDRHAERDDAMERRAEARLDDRMIGAAK